MFLYKSRIFNTFMLLLLSSFLFLLFILFFDSAMFVKFKNSFFIKIIFFAFLFIILSLFFTFYKFSKTALYKIEEKNISNILEENEELKKLAKIDLITKKFNKEYFDLRYKQEFKRAIRENQNISLLIININEFKAYNELYGEDEGNKCLKKVAEVLSKQCVRPSDILSRMEADTFYILLPNTKNARLVAKKCKKAVDDLSLEHDNSILANIVRIKCAYSTVEAKNINQMAELIEITKASLLQMKKKKISFFK